MSGDVDIVLSPVRLFGLLLLVTTLRTVVGKSDLKYCPRKCQCEHAQLVCGGACRGHSTKRITEIPARLDEITTRIEIGNFSRNLITKILYGDFFGLEMTKILDLSHNRIHLIEEGGFEMMTPRIKLRILYLSYNRLNHLRLEMFTGLDNLWQLYIGHNKLHFIAANTFMNMQDLHLLSLRNALSQWDFSTKPLTSLKRLKMVYLAQTNTTYCSCGLRHFIDDVIMKHIDVIDEIDAIKYCAIDDVKCENKSVLNKAVTPYVIDDQFFRLEDLSPPVSSSGIITFEGRSYSLYEPEGKRLLMMYDMEMRRKIARIQQPTVRGDYERRFRRNMREMIDKIYYNNENRLEQSSVTTFTANKPTTERSATQSLRLPASQAGMSYLLLEDLESWTEEKSFPDENEFQNLHQSSSDQLKVPTKDRSKGSRVDAGITMAISLGSLTIFFFMLAIVISLTLKVAGHRPDKVKRSDVEGTTSTCSGCSRCCERITSKLAIRKKFIKNRGPTSSPKSAGFVSLHKSAKKTLDEKRRLHSTGCEPLPEEAIQALTREQRRRSLGGLSRASSEITGFESDSDSDHELFHENFFTSK